MGIIEEAARTAFKRTLYQALAGILSGTAVVDGIIAMINGVDMKMLISSSVVAIVAPFVSALSAYFMIKGNGIPQEYYEPIVKQGPPF